MKCIEAIKERPYAIYIEKSYDRLFEVVEGLIKPSQIIIVTDTHVAPLYLEIVKEKLSPLAPVYQHVFEAGEHSKTLETVKQVYDTLLEHAMDRSGLIVALGGGVVGDLAGFVASSYMRGVPFIQLPTTVVSQNDSSIGGKVGVDYFAHKNMVGAFYNPILIYANICTLDTLPQRELVGGISEVIKHGIIESESLYAYLEEHYEGILAKDHSLLEEMTYRSCCVKCGVVATDLTEKGRRKILNFGHTIGHAVETLSDFTLNHGECVAYGMVMASFISCQKGLCKKEQLESLEKLCRRYGLLQAFPIFDSEQVLKQMTYDKKKGHGKLAFILLQAIGDVIIAHDVTEQEIREALHYVSETCV